MSPQPWKIVRAKTCFTIKDANGKAVAVVSRRPDSEENNRKARADAELIRSAPELLEILNNTDFNGVTRKP